MKVPFCIFIFYACYLTACNWTTPQSNEGLRDTSTATSDTLTVEDTLAAKIDTVLKIDSTLIDSTTTVDNAQNKDTPHPTPPLGVDIKNVHPEDVMRFAESLYGIPYVYASINPKVGFDCSGFITHVFNNFGIKVPRSSVEFTNVGKTIPVESAKRGDIILFTGTNPAERRVGHMGLIVSTKDTLKFIHSSSGKAMGVTVSPFGSRYQTRFVKTIRIFPQNDL
jgi:cell wall-associated NlpC family hydrolase